MRGEFSRVAIVADSVTTTGVASKIGDDWEMSRSNRVRMILPTFQMLIQNAVTFASSILQAGAIFYLHMAALVGRTLARGDLGKVPLGVLACTLLTPRTTTSIRK